MFPCVPCVSRLPGCLFTGTSRVCPVRVSRLPRVFFYRYFLYSTTRVQNSPSHNWPLNTWRPKWLPPPWVIAPWRGERELVPVSNLALHVCRVVDMREDGRTLRLFRGRRGYFYSPPLGSPIWGFTAHVGGRTPPAPEFSLGLAALSLFMAVSQLSVCMCSNLGVRYSCVCIHTCNE